MASVIDAIDESWRVEMCGRAIRSGHAAGDGEAEAKALVMSYAKQEVSEGRAEWNVLDSGDVELRFRSGEIYVLGEFSVTRTA